MSRTSAERATKLPLSMYRAEVAWRKTAKARTGAEWRMLIDGLRGRRIRIQVACIVWWDWLAERLTEDRAPELDDLVAQWESKQNADKLKVRDALVAIGYPERIADNRTIHAAWNGLSSNEQARRK